MFSLVRTIAVAVALLLLMAAETVHAQSATTGAATGVTDLGATLSGTLDSTGSTFWASFQLGTDTTYGTNLTPTADFFENSPPETVTVSTTSLQPNTTYHYRLIGDNPYYTSVYGQDMTFTTGPPATPPSMTGTLETFASQQQEMVLLLPNVFSGAAATTVVLEYGPTTDYGATETVANLTPNSSTGGGNFTMWNLTPGSTYHLHLKASSALGTLATPDVSFTTTNPEVMTIGAATNVTDLSATLNATLIQNGNHLNQVYFLVGTDATNNWEVFTSANGTDPQAISATATNLQPNTQYHFRLAIQDSELGYLYSDYQYFTTGPAATPPSVTGNVYVETTSPSVAIVSISSVSAGSSPATVVFEYGATTAYGSQIPLPSPLGTSTSSYEQMTLTGLQPGATYHVRCTATNGQGVTSSPDTVFTMPPAPVVVTGAATAVSDLYATLNGSANAGGTLIWLEFEWGTDTSYGNVVSAPPYDIENTTTQAVTGYPVGLVPGTTYHYRLRAYDENSVYYYGADMTFTTAPASTPPTVGTLFVQTVNPTSAVVYDFPVSSGSSAATVNFDYGTSTAYGSTVSLAYGINVSDMEPEVTLTGLSMLTTYYVRCRVTNSVGTVTSSYTTFTTPGVPVVTTGAATAADITATLNGTVNANYASSYAQVTFDYGITTDYGITMDASPYSVNVPTLTPVTGLATGLLPNTTYHYRTKAYYPYTGLYFYGQDAAFTTSAPATAPTVGTPLAVQVTDATAVVEVSINAGSSDAAVIWQYGPTTAYGSSIAGNPTSVPISTVGGSLAFITGLTPNTTYHCCCTATNAQGATSSVDATFNTLNAPVLTTSPLYTATDLTANVSGTATLNGNTFSGYDFEWGADTTYGSVIIAWSIVGQPSSNPVPLNATLSGLLPNTTYHFRVKGMCSDGNWYYGQDQTLTTGPPNTPPTVTTGTANPVTTTSMALTFATLQTGSSATTLSYDYGMDTTYGANVAYPTPLPPSQSYGPFLILIGASGTANQPFPVQVNDLTPNTTYHFRAKVVNNEGTSYGADATFTTPGPPVVTTTAATNVDTVCATLNGTLGGQGVSYTIAFDYGATTDYGSTVAANSLVLATGGDGGIIIGGTLTFTGGAGLIKSGAGTGTLTLAGTTTYAGTTGSVFVVNGFGGDLFLNGTSTIDLSTASNAVRSNAETPCSSGGCTGTCTTDTGIIVITSGGGGTINGPFGPYANVTGLTPNTTYHYRFKATDSSGATYYGDDMTFTTLSAQAVAQNWRQEYFGSPDDSGFASDMASPSGDGIPNLVKYALGLDPNVSSASSMPQPTLKDYNGLTYLDLTFQRDSSMTDLTYAVQAADNPAGPWTTVASSIGGAATTGPGFVTENLGYGIGATVSSLAPTTIYTVEVHDTVSTADAQRRFLRLQVTRP